jgi:hypothetical protein
MKQAPGIIMCLMSDLREDTLIVLYDDDCGFCEVMRERGNAMAQARLRNIRITGVSVDQALQMRAACRRALRHFERRQRAQRRIPTPTATPISRRSASACAPVRRPCRSPSSTAWATSASPTCPA